LLMPFSRYAHLPHFNQPMPPPHSEEPARNHDSRLFDALLVWLVHLFCRRVLSKVCPVRGVLWVWCGKVAVRLRPSSCEPFPDRRTYLTGDGVVLWGFGLVGGGK